MSTISPTYLSKILPRKRAEIAYTQFGSGKVLLFAFHGYSNSADLFLELASVLSEKYTVISIDLPWHGRTKIGDTTFGKNDFLAVLKHIAADFPDREGLELMGFSYGGRVCLNVFEALDARHLWLLAADGLNGSRLFHYVPRRARHLIARIFDKPSRFLHLLHYLYKCNIIPNSTYYFMSYHLENRDNQKQLIGTWLFLPGFAKRRKNIIAGLKAKNTGLTMIFGNRDKIISAKGGFIFKRAYAPAEIHFINTGHRIFTKELKQLLYALMS